MAAAVQHVPEIPVEIMDLRHFGAAELRPLLMEEARLWSDRMSWDYHGSAEMILRYLDSKILPGYAAVDDGRVLGYSFFVYEGSKGVIGDLYVTNGARLPEARKVELNLLTHVIETLQQSPGIHRVEAQLLAHEANLHQLVDGLRGGQLTDDVAGRRGVDHDEVVVVLADLPRQLSDGEDLA